MSNFVDMHGQKKGRSGNKGLKQIKIELMCAFQTFLEMASVVKCKFFPLPVELVI